ncbi:MAG: hypothetical protein EZS28_026093 [Streblomastix strix]|uniref:Uncharacterized protein n=1 Tax=Streblomastix strix TaxID=222440 RepID=A0A5J4V7L2_9EUKA|nr:MAG: hypothetical protein EZS28_026093 [Streblomastix strix]
MTLGTGQKINANKTFDNACRFVSSIDGISTVTGSSFVKSGADDTVILLGAGGTKPISEFVCAPTELSNYYNKSEPYSRTETDNKYVRLEGSVQQTITGRLKYVSLFDGTYDETSDPVANTYLTMSAFDARLTNYVNTVNDQSINVTKTFDANVNATGFVKTDKDDTSVLLAGGGDRLLSAFGGVQVEDITNLIVDLHSNITFNYLRLVRIRNFYHLMMDFQPKTQINIATNSYVCTIGSFSNTITPPTSANEVYLISIISKQTTLIGGLTTRQIRINTDSSTPCDKALLDAAGLLEFPEYNAYIHEREPKPIDQVKDNDDKLLIQPILPELITHPISVAAEIITIPLNALTQPLHLYNINDGGIKFYKLRNIVVHNIVLYLREDFMGFVFSSFPVEQWPFCKHVLELGDDVGHIQNVKGYISEKGFYLDVSIESVDQVTSIKGNTHIAIADVYYTDYESLKRATNDVNGDGKINIVDDWHVNSIIDGMKSMSWVQDVMQKQTEAIGDGVQPYDPSIPILTYSLDYLNSSGQRHLIPPLQV